MVTAQNLIDESEYRKLEIYIKVGFEFNLFDINGDKINDFGSGESSLFRSALFGDIKTIKQFNHVNIVNNNGYSPLSWAVINNQELAFNVLVDKGAKLNLLNDKDENILHLACKYKSYDILKILIKKLPYNLCLAKNYRGFTPFLFLCANGCTEYVETLTDRLDVDCLMEKNIFNASALHWLSYHCKKDYCSKFNYLILKIISKIKSSGRDINSLLEKNAINFNPLDWLERNNSFQTANIIKKMES